MSSLPFPLGLCTPTKLDASSLSLCPNLDLARARNAPEISASNSRAWTLQPPLLSRREVVRIAASTLGLFWRPQLSVAAVTEESSCELSLALSGLAFCDVMVGAGPQAAKGQLIKGHYVGKLENGKVFDSSYSRGKPLTFRVDAGEVIKGWDEGILCGDGVPPMLAGGKRKLKLPPELGYGVRGAGCRGGSCIIPPNSVLYFDVEFIGKA